jgi:hypothetical protein
MPDKKNKDAWWAFLEGAPESVWNPSRPIRNGGPFTSYSGLILPPTDPSATYRPPPITLLDDDATQKPRELSPTQLFQLDHVCLLPLAGNDCNSSVGSYLAILSSTHHVLYALVQLAS